MLKLCEIEKAFGEKRVLNKVSLHIKRGEIVVLSGASGGGKTTLLRIAAGLEKADRGMVARNGTLAVVFAEARLFPSVTVLENVTAVMKGDRAKHAAKAREILALLGLSEAEALYPEELSSGMAARVSIARAMAYDADIYLLDEPLKSLDGELKAQVMADLRLFFKDKAVFVISHDETEAVAMATKRLKLDNGILSDVEMESGRSV